MVAEQHLYPASHSSAPGSTAHPAGGKPDKSPGPGPQVFVELPTGECRLEPLLALSVQHLSILFRGSATALHVGAAFSSVRVFGAGSDAGNCILAGSAIVADVLPTGQPGTCKVTLQLQAIQGEPVDSFAEPDIIAETVKNLLDAKARTAVSVPVLGREPATGTFLRSEGEPQGLILEMHGSVADFAPGQACELVTQFYGNRLGLVGKIQRIATGRRGAIEVLVSWPTLLKKTPHRIASRIRSLPAAVRAHATLPFATAPQVLSVVDLSPRGFGFTAMPGDALALGMVIRNVDLHLPHGVVRAHAVVRNVRVMPDKSLAVGVALKDLTPAAERMLAEFVNSQAYPTARLGRPGDAAQVWPLYRAAQLIDSDPAVAMRSMRQFEATRATLLARGASLLIQMVSGDDTQVQSSADLVRTREKTWSLMHLAHKPEQGGEAVLMPLFQTAMRRADVGYVHALIRVEDVLQALSSLATLPHGTELSTRVWTLVTGMPAPLAADVSDEAHDAGPDDRPWVLRKLEQVLTPLECAAHDITDRQLTGNELGRYYRGVGLDAARIVRLANSISGNLGFSLIDNVASGISLEPWANTARLYPTGISTAGRRSALMTLAQDAGTVQARLGHPARYLVSPADAELLTGGALQNRGSYIEIVVARDAVDKLMEVLDLLQAR